MRSRWRIAPPSPLAPDHQTTGATRATGRGRRTRRGKRSAHGQRPGGRPQRQRGCKGARPARNRPRRRRGARERAPRPPLKFPLGGEPRRGKPDGGKGGAPLDGRGGGRGASPREMNSSALPHATASVAAIGRASGRRRAAAAPEGRKGHAPARHADARESAASGQAAQTDDGEAASGRGSCCTFTARSGDGATTPTDDGTAAKAGGDGAGRAALGRDCWPPTPCHQRRAHLSGASAARPTQTGATSMGRRTGARPPDAANRRARHKLPCPAPRGAQGQADGQPGKPPGAQRTGATAQRANLAVCAPLWRFFPLVAGNYASFAEKTLERAKKRKKGA